MAAFMFVGTSRPIASSAGTFFVTPDDYVASLPPSSEGNAGGLVVELPTGGNALISVNGDANVTSLDIAFVGSAEQLYLLLEPLQPALSGLSTEARGAVIRLISTYESGDSTRLETAWFTLVRPPGQPAGSLWPLMVLAPG